MLKSVASILESMSSVAIMALFLLMILIVLTGCCFGSIFATEFAQIMQTPLPY